ncbi:MAG: hypothetical protein ABII88_04045 [Candidatus Omnitrophota bacterium]
MKQIIKIIIIMMIGLSVSGCSLRMGDYGFKKDTGFDDYYHKDATGYFETELRSHKYFDMVDLSWGLGFLRGKSGGKVNYSTENATHYFPHTKDAINAHMWDTRITARAYPLKSVNIFKSGWTLSPYVGAGYGYFSGEAERNSQGSYLGLDIYGGRHYGLNTTKSDFDGSFWSNCLGVELGREKSKMFFVVEYRQDMDKEDGSINFDADQVIVGLGANW